jgi:hypothetical protein
VECIKWSKANFRLTKFKNYFLCSYVFVLKFIPVCAREDRPFSRFIHMSVSGWRTRMLWTCWMVFKKKGGRQQDPIWFKGSGLTWTSLELDHGLAGSSAAVPEHWQLQRSERKLSSLNSHPPIYVFLFQNVILANYCTFFNSSVLLSLFPLLWGQFNFPTPKIILDFFLLNQLRIRLKEEAIQRSNSSKKHLCIV